LSITVIFVSHGGAEQKTEGEIGMTILQLAQENGIEMEGACEGNMACSTCHVIVEKGFFTKLPAACEYEEDMLDLASDLRATSRLGCQIVLQKELDGMRLQLPKDSRNMLGL